MVSPQIKREASTYLQSHQGLSQRKSCNLVQLHRSVGRYIFKKKIEDTEIKEKLKQYADQRPRFGYRRLGMLLRNQEGLVINDKCVPSV